MTQESGKGNAGKDLPHDAEQIDAAVVVAVTAVSLVLVQRDDLAGRHACPGGQLLRSNRDRGGHEDVAVRKVSQV